MRSRVISNTLTTFLTQVFVFGASTIIGVLVTRLLGPEGRGEYFLAFSLSILLFVLIKSSVEVAGTYFVGREGYQVSELPGHYLAAAGLMSAVTLLILGLSWGPLKAAFFPALPTPYLMIALAAVAPNLIVLYFASILMLIERVGTYNRIFILQQLVTAIGLVVLTLWLGLGVAGALTAFFLGLAVAAMYAFIVVHRAVRPTYRVNRVFLGKLFSFGLKGHVGEILDFFVSRMDTFLINFFLGTVSVGYYSVALTAELLWYVPNSIITVLYPKFAQHTGDTVALARKVTRVTLWVTLVPGFILMLLAKPLISWAFGSAFLPAVIPFLIVVPGIACLSVSKTLKIFLSGQGKPLPATYASIATLLVNVAGNILLIPKFGLPAAAGMVSVSYMLYSALIYIQAARMYPLPLRDVLLPRLSDLQELRALMTEGRA